MLSKISKADWKKNCQLRILFSVKITYKYKHEIKAFSDTKAESSNLSPTETQYKNVKGSPSERMKMPKGNTWIYTKERRALKTVTMYVI